MILVTGATGYTGPFVVEALIRAGAHVRALVREESRARPILKMGADFVIGDLENERSVANTLDGVEAVLAVSHIRHAPTLVRACKDRGVTRTIFFSSARSASTVPSPSVDEVLEGESAVFGSDLQFTLLRPTMIYGPGNDRNVAFIRGYIDSHRFLPVFGSGERLQQPVFVRDVADAVSKIVFEERTIGKSYFLAGPNPITYTGMIDPITAASKRTIVKVYLPVRMSAWAIGCYERLSSAPRITSEMVRRFDEEKTFDISDAQRDFGYDPVPFEEGFRLISESDP